MREMCLVPAARAGGNQASSGDQFSDLIGGFADKTFKLPNPNYFLP